MRSRSLILLALGVAVFLCSCSGPTIISQPSKKVRRPNFSIEIDPETTLNTLKEIVNESGDNNIVTTILLDDGDKLYKLTENAYVGVEEGGVNISGGYVVGFSYDGSKETKRIWSYQIDWIRIEAIKTGGSSVFGDCYLQFDLFRDYRGKREQIRIHFSSKKNRNLFAEHVDSYASYKLREGYERDMKIDSSASKIKIVDKSIKALDAPDGKKTADTGTAGKSGAIIITSIPANAEIYLNGEFIATASEKPITLSVRTHQIEVKKAGYKTWEREVRILKGNVMRINVELQKTDDE